MITAGNCEETFAQRVTVLFNFFFFIRSPLGLASCSYRSFQLVKELKCPLDA